MRGEAKVSYATGFLDLMPAERIMNNLGLLCDIRRAADIYIF